MSQQITTAFVEQYSANVQFLSQQERFAFQGKTRVESQLGKTKFFEQIGATTAIKRTARHGDTPQVDSKHRRREVTLDDYEWADLVDKQDEIRVLIEPKSAYARNAAMAMNRAMDASIIAAATGDARGVVDDTGTVKDVALPNTQKIAVDFGSPGNNSGLTLAKLIQTKHILGKNERPAGSKLYFAYSQQQLTDLLTNVEQVSNSDYASVKALVNGEVSNFVGFEFIQTELVKLDTGTDIRTCFGYVKDFLLFSVGQTPVSRISERGDKSYSVQVYSSGTWGATRMQEEMVVACYCDESP